MNKKKSIGIIGARGYVGVEFIKLIATHENLELAFVSSRELAGQLVSQHIDTFSKLLHFSHLDENAVAKSGADIVVLALPNQMASCYVKALDESVPSTLIVDLSADYRFDATWFYGLPELYRAQYAGQRRISNPGCYATAMQLAIAPMRDLLAQSVQCFGVSGYSGSGTMPSTRNNPQNLRDNLIPYSLIGHLHEQEVSYHLNHTVEFMPHVAAFFRGITVTVNFSLHVSVALDAVKQRYRDRYADEPLVKIVDETPWVNRIAGHHGVEIGGFTLRDDGKRLVVVATLDNLLKGAATQALQNINLACGWTELMGIPHG